jgi:PAS domain S-box-containing protein
MDQLNGGRLARALLEAVSDLVFVIGRDGIYRGVKAEHAGDLAAPPERLVGSHIDDVLPPDVAEQIMAAAARALERNSVEAVDYVLELGGKERVFEGRVAASGEDEFLLIVRDATERRRHDDELRRLAAELEQRVAELGRERDFTRTLVRSVPSFLILVDAGGGLLGLNDSTELATGYTTEETVGDPFWEVLIPEWRWDDARGLFAALLAEQEPADPELELITRAGDLRIVEWSGTPVIDQFGLVRVILSGVDVTERVRHEDELRRSRARIVEASDAERRRLQRNLHDGAQQHLVVVSQQLRMARTMVERNAAGAAALLDRAIEAMTLAHRELRELARGLHPPLLTERGLAAAVRALGLRSPLAVGVDIDDRERFPAAVEAAAYYFVSEALTNVAKYAAADEARVEVQRAGATAVVRVSDDGVGGASPEHGSGLSGLRDRVEALGGEFELDSPPGAGTTLRATLPLT